MVVDLSGNKNLLRHRREGSSLSASSWRILTAYGDAIIHEEILATATNLVALSVAITPISRPLRLFRTRW